jgi:predicted ATPase/DNA-binding SARP family transcriptional activator
MPRKSKLASPLELYLLDSFRLVRNAKIIQLPTHKDESLLAYLALDPKAHPREKLACLFWGDCSDTLSHTSLRTALAVLRKHLGTDAIIANRATVQINLAHFCMIDALEFAKALDLHNAHSRQAEIEKIESAISLYQGDLLAGFYDDWIDIERERYRSMFIDALLLMTQKMRARSEYKRAVEYASRVLQTDPANEAAHQHLMCCYLAMGKRLEALRQFKQCKQVLRDELGVEPSRDTIVLFETIRRANDMSQSYQAMLTNLPTPVTSFVGREQELAQVKQLFSTTRLVTLTGAGGIGKTRLAKQVAFELVNEFRDGAWFVELTELKDSALVPRAVAKTMGVREVSDESIDQILIRALATRHALMVLDNCEHLVETCAQLCERLLSACPTLTILATSREILGINGETVWRVPPLKMPEVASNFNQVNLLMQFDAVRLFVERAMVASPSFELSEQNASEVMQICQRLDGIPLALELAAARTKTMSLEHIANNLDDRFRLLTGGSRTAMPRYQTLRATIDWSYGMLTEDERMLFRGLSVFWGGWTLEAAEQVCSGLWLTNRPTSQRVPSVLDLLTRLVDKSLVLMDELEGEPRFRFLETIRQYARDKLLAVDESTLVHNGHRDWFLEFATQVEPRLRSAGQLYWLNRLESEVENFRAALEWSLGHTENVEDAEKGLHLVGVLSQFWVMHGYFREGRNWIEQAIKSAERAQIKNKRCYARVYSGVGVLAWLQGDLKVAAEYAQACLDLASEFQDRWLMGIALHVLGEYARNYEHDFGRAHALASEGLTLARKLGDSWLVALMLFDMGINTLLMCDSQLATNLLEEASNLCREIGDVWLGAAIVDQLGEQAFLQADFDRAAELYDEGLRLRRELRDKSGVIGSLNNLGKVARAQGDYDRARSFFDAGLTMSMELGQNESVAILQYNLAYVAKHQSNVAQAQTYFQSSIRLFKNLGDIEGVGDCLAGLASVAVENADYKRAARLLGACQSILASIDAHLSSTDMREFESSLAQVHHVLDDAECESLLQQGRAFSVDMAIDCALEN